MEGGQSEPRVLPKKDPRLGSRKSGRLGGLTLTRATTAPHLHQLDGRTYTLSSVCEWVRLNPVAVRCGGPLGQRVLHYFRPPL
jgi:hypothetical protein